MFLPVPVLPLKFVHLLGESDEETDHWLSDRPLSHLADYKNGTVGSRERIVMCFSRVKNRYFCLQQQFRLCWAAFLGLALKWLKMKT